MYVSYYCNPKFKVYLDNFIYCMQHCNMYVIIIIQGKICMRDA